MTASTTHPVGTAPGRPPRSLRWRVVDIVTASVLAVACGFIFVAWNIGYQGPSAAAQVLLPGLQGLVDGPWLIAGPLVAFVIRKPGAALYGEMLAASVSALVGSQWGFTVLLSGFVQGVGAELVLALFLYRYWTVTAAVLAGIGAAVGGAAYNLISYYAALATEAKIIYFTSSVLSGAVIAGLGAWLIVRALAAVDLRMPLATATSTLSGGRKQRLGVAGVLAMRPGALLLDEPTANLDPAGVAEVRDAVVAAVDATGATLVVVEHRIEVWSEVVDRIVVLEPGGGVRADGPPQEVLRGDGDALFTEGVWIPRRPPRSARAPRPPGTPLLSSADLAVGRGGAPVAAPPDLTVGRGGATAIVGANGLGKSTLALTLAGLIAPVAGRVVASEALRGPLGPDPLRWRSRDLVRRIGTVFQNPEHQFVRATVRAELAVGLEAIGVRGRAADDRVDELLERLRLTAMAQANPFTLSGGEKRRLSVATALATSPAVLVIDEPTFGQDSRTWAGLVDLVNAELDAGTAVVAVTHDLDFAAAIGAAPFTWAPAGAAA